VFVDAIFGNVDNHNASTLAIAAVLFSFQIYCDFSGYSDIAIGLGKLFGIELMRNFNVPYFSRDIAEFWRRWHISLTTWFRDYVYIPLGGSRPTNSQGIALEGMSKKTVVVRNTFVIFLLSGFWHGANWTFLLWGFFHAVLFMPLILLEKNRKYTDVVAVGRFLPSIKEFSQIIFTFILATLGWIIFRADNIEMVNTYFTRLFDSALWGIPYLTNKVFTFLPLSIMIFMEWIHRGNSHGLSLEMVKNRFVRYMIYFALAIFIVINMGPEQNFIYFQF
jgi:D-alanyl-lipoteichoic acid acyltransferase DltB (MBOAT superfamily)